MNEFDVVLGIESEEDPSQSRVSTPQTKESKLSDQLFEEYRARRTNWAMEAQKDSDFRHGAQWTPKQIKELAKLRMSPIVVNVIHPAIEQGKAALTSNKPRFSATGREGSDMKIGTVFADLLSYIWDHSLGNVQLKQAIDDYYVKGMGILMGYVDPNGDNGKGEVCFRCLDPLDVYIDPNAKDVFCRDAAHILISQVQTSEQLQRSYPQILPLLKRAKEVADDETRPYSGREGLESQGSSSQQTDRVHKKYRLTDRYSRVKVAKFHVYDPNVGMEQVLSNEEYKAYLETPCFIEQTKQSAPVAITVESAIRQAQDVYNRLGEVFHYVIDPNDPNGKPMKQAGPENPEEDAQMGLQTIPGSEVSLKKVTARDVIQAGIITVDKILVDRIKRVFTVGGIEAYIGILPSTDYPIITLMNRHDRNPYPMSDVRFCRGLQEYINKLRSLIIAHASNSTSVKLLIPKGSMERAELLAEWGRAGAGVIEFDAELGQPTVAGPVPLPTELYRNEAEARKDVQEIFGIYSLGQGDSSQAPSTYKGTVALDEYGQRRIKSKKDDIEDALNQLARVLVQFIQATYTEPKTLRLIRPNNVPLEFGINIPSVLDANISGAIPGRINDITVGTFDVVVISGSTLPVNRWARLEYYMELYKNGIIDQLEVLKQTEVADIEGVTERMGEIQKLRSALAQAEEEIKNLKGDLQTATRESVNDRKRLEVEKFKSDVNLKKAQVEAGATIMQQTMSNQAAMHKELLAADRKVRSAKPKSDSK